MEELFLKLKRTFSFDIGCADFVSIFTNSVVLATNVEC